MIIGIEGTGSQGWGQLNLRRTFVRRVLNQSPDNQRYFFIGPNLMGTDGSTIIDGAWEVLKRGAQQNPQVPIHLVGYSRGAAYCIELAYRMLDLPVERRMVDTLILFDAVDRQPNIRADKIPANVRRCFHAYRDPRAASRNYFKNCGLYLSSVAAKINLPFEKHPFRATHGGMGGVPWHAQVQPDFKPLAATLKEAAANPPTAIQLLNLVSRKAGAALKAAHIGIEAYAWYVTAEGEFDDADLQALWVWLKDAGTSANPAKQLTVELVTRFILRGDRGELTTDRDLLNISATPTVNYEQDKAGSAEVGKWMWERLAKHGVVPRADGYLKLAPTAPENMTPGQPYRIVDR